MRVQHFLILCLLTIAATSCGLTGASSGIEVTYDGKSAMVEPESTAVIVDTISDSVSHTFVIANYELGDEITQRSLSGTAKEEGRKRVLFTIIGEKRTDEKTPVKVGVYPARVGNVGSSTETVNSGNIFYSEDGKENAAFVGGADMKAGKVKIDSVSGGTISGEVDITDGKDSIKGKFTVKIQ